MLVLRQRCVALRASVSFRACSHAMLDGVERGFVRTAGGRFRVRGLPFVFSPIALAFTRHVVVGQDESEIQRDGTRISDHDVYWNATLDGAGAASCAANVRSRICPSHMHACSFPSIRMMQQAYNESIDICKSAALLIEPFYRKMTLPP